MKYLIRRTQLYDGARSVEYMQGNGFFGGIETARAFDSKEGAAYMADLEKSDPKYKKSYMGRSYLKVIKGN